MFARLLRESGLLEQHLGTEIVGNVFDKALEHLKRQRNRHEYIYKAAITKKILLGVHSLQTASMLTEFRVGPCKADVVILNGTSIVYEIKSERDSLTRLEAQLDAYMKVFASVNVIVGENHLDEVEKSVSEEIGIQKLSSKYQISTVREGVDKPSRTHTGAIFDAINLKEAEAILRDLRIYIPEVPNTQKYGVLRKLFTALESEEAHRGMVRILKKTRNLHPLKTLLDDLPESLHTASLSMRLRKRDHERLIHALRIPIHQAICWG